MSQKIDHLSLYAGLNPTYTSTSQRQASLYQAISGVFNRAENVLSFLQLKRSSHQSTKLN
jgi:oligoendopeptidase F